MPIYTYHYKYGTEPVMNTYESVRIELCEHYKNKNMQVVSYKKRNQVKISETSAAAVICDSFENYCRLGWRLLEASFADRLD
jgi:hypothetical protein